MIENWQRTALTSYSNLTMLLGLLVLLVPNFAFAYLSVELDPYRAGNIAAILFVAGIIGRHIDQKNTSLVWKSPIMIAMIWAIAQMGILVNDGAKDYQLKSLAVQTDQTAQDWWADPSPVLAMSQAPAPEPLPLAGDPFDDIAFELIAKWEGKRNRAYFDIVNVATICYGHTRTVTAADVRAGVTWSDERCRSLLIEEIHEYRDNWLNYVNDDVKTALPDTREAAFTSLAFNVGWVGAGRSTATRRLNANDVVGACDALTWWNKAGGRVVRGLVNRRAEEQRYCLGRVS